MAAIPWSGSCIARFAIVCVLAVLALGAASPTIANLWIPEDTIVTYYRGYKLGDRGLIARAFLAVPPSGIAEIGLGDEIEYTIEEKVAVLHSRLHSQGGDIKIVTYAKWSTARGVDELITAFVLRQVREEWKIVGYDSVGRDGCSPDGFLDPPSRMGREMSANSVATTVPAFLTAI
ncbi:MAG: hypothetical protein MUE60_16405 [Candidatus Eisenbacteria bacterium]|nr:hypothetical protein [Candidatus Eisenbacteria bacterium]